MKRSIPLETVVDVNDPNLWFYFIHSFPSYEISSPISHDIYDRNGILLYNKGSSIVRSLKSVYQYNYGILVRPRSRANPNDPTFELTNNQNERVCVRLSQLVYLAKNPPFAVSGYPRHANMVGLTCRNDRKFIVKKLKSPQLDNTTRFYPKFHIIADEDEVLKKNPNMIPVNSLVHIPIESIDGSEYYGRKDIIIEYYGENN